MRLKGLHHARFAVTDLDKTERFATDFGLKTVKREPGRLFMRTDGGDAYCYVAEQAAARGFTGLAFSVEGVGDLEEAIARHGASPIRDLDGPGGGKAVTLIDPEGLAFDLVCDIADEAPGDAPPRLALNTPGAMVRFDVAQSQRAR